MIGIEASNLYTGAYLYGYKLYLDNSDFNVIVKQQNKILKITRKLLHLESKDLECFNYSNKVKFEDLNTISVKIYPTEITYITEASITEQTVLNILENRIQLLAEAKLDHYHKVLNSTRNLIVRNMPDV